MYTQESQKAILVMSLRNLKKTTDYLGIDDDTVESLLRNGIPSYFICIKNSKEDDSIFKRNHVNVLNLTFDDVTFQQKDTVMFSKDQAREIIKFADQLKDLDKYNLTVQCEAGMSRSGAVGEVLNDYLGLDYHDFKFMNPQVMPNSLVRSLLKRVIEDNYKEKEKTSL